MPLNPAGVPSMAAIQAAIDEAVADTGWVALTHAGTAGTLRYRVKAGVVYVEASVTISMATGVTVTVLTSGNALPAPYRPAASLWVPGRVGLGALSAQVARNADGTIQAVQTSGSTAPSIQFAYSYPVG